MRWNELNRKSIGYLIALAVLFAGAVLIGALTIAKRRGGEEIAAIVRDSIQAERLTAGSAGARIVSDRIIVVFRNEVPDAQKKDIAKNAGVRLEGTVADRPGAYVLRLRPATWREIRILLESLRLNPSVLEAEAIVVD